MHQELPAGFDTAEAFALMGASLARELGTLERSPRRRRITSKHCLQQARTLEQIVIAFERFLRHHEAWLRECAKRPPNDDGALKELARRIERLIAAGDQEEAVEAARAAEKKPL